jgi:hypothetical protein
MDALLFLWFFLLLRDELQPKPSFGNTTSSIAFTRWDGMM